MEIKVKFKRFTFCVTSDAKVPEKMSKPISLSF